jgi:tetratricopeptide (TPR) repeat protein
MRIRFVPLLAGLLAALPAAAHPAAAPPAAADAGASLGPVHVPVSCKPSTQAGFDRAMALLHHMTYPKARTAFEALLAADPDCAMAHWGVAMTLFQPLWPTRPGPEALQRGWTEVQAAKAAKRSTPRERAFIAAAEAFFLEPAGTDYWLRIRRWAAASAAAHVAFPADDEATLFHALALLATAPSNTVSRGNADAAAALLTGVLARQPDHPGAMHYLVHANDIPGRENLQGDTVHRYELVAPRNPHALHMPTHIYTRQGDWDGVIRGNRRAAEAAREQPAGDKGQYVWDEYPHAVEYLVYAHLQKGEDAAARREIATLRAIPNLEPSFKTAFHLASTQAREALERRDWVAAAAIVPRQSPAVDWDKFPWPEAVSRFAQGLGAAHVGKPDIAQAAAARLVELEAAATASGETLFARNIQMLRLELEGWIAQAGGDAALARERMAAAVALEADTPKHAVTPAATLPAQELLGDLLMAQSRPAEALAAYRAALARDPFRLNALLGAARSAAASGDHAAATGYAAQLATLAGKGDRVGLAEEIARFRH